MYRRCVDDEIMMIMMIVMMMIMIMTTTPYVGRVLWLAFIPAAMAVFSGSSVYLPPQKSLHFQIPIQLLKAISVNLKLPRCYSP